MHLINIRTACFTQQKEWGLYQNKVNSSLAASQRPGHQADNCKMVYCVVFSELFTLSITLDTLHWRNSVSLFDLSKEAVIRVQLLKTGRVPLVPQCNASTNNDWLELIRSKKRLTRDDTGSNSTEAHWYGMQNAVDPHWYGIKLNWIALIRSEICGWSVLIRDQTRLNRTDTGCKMRLIRIDTGLNSTESHWYGRKYAADPYWYGIKLDWIALIRAAKCSWSLLIRDQTRLNHTVTGCKMR